MIRPLVAFTVFIAFFNCAFASEERGLYVNLNNDTIRGKIKVYECIIPGAKTVRIDNIYDRQFKMLFVDALGNAHDLTPDTVNAVIIFDGESKGVYQKCKTFTWDRIFLKYDVYGKARLLHGYYGDQLGTDSFAMEHKKLNGTCALRSPRYYLQKEEGKITAADDVFLKKFLYKFFSDVPELVEKIKTGIYKDEDLKTMIMEYNYWALNGHGPDLVAPSDKKY